MVSAGGLLGFAAGVVAGRWAWLVLVVVALVIYVSVGTGADVPPDWMAKAIPVLPFAFIGLGIGIGVRRALHQDTSRRRGPVFPFGLGAQARDADTGVEMSAWRSEAERRLPELWRDETARATPYLFFFALLPFVHDAHRSGDDHALARAYGFALWCYRQAGDLQNAATVAFYEHLFDSWDIHADVLRWLDPQVARDCWPLYEARLDAQRLAVLRERLDV
ncbi:MAG TPA: hypothetical protein VGV67_08045 [Solirubrobacteraceae bacterium]|nr:hypothetical protein [Solirubrobacteraceae bacterium]